MGGRGKSRSGGKGKGECEDLNNHRNIHIVSYLPKAFETILVEKVKSTIIEQCSKFQIGAMPGHRPQEHLFVLKSIIALYIYLNIPLILQGFDVSKFFDKESLLDALNALYEAGIRGKTYRLFFELNKNSKIRIKACVGTSRTANTGPTVTVATLEETVIP